MLRSLVGSEMCIRDRSPREARRSTPDIPLVAAHPLPTTKTIAYAVLLKFQGDHVRCPISSDLFITPKCTVANPNPAAAIVESAVGEDEAWHGGGSSSGLYVGSHSYADCQSAADPMSASLSPINPSLSAPRSWKAAYESQLATFATIMQMLAGSTNNTTQQATSPSSHTTTTPSLPAKVVSSAMTSSSSSSKIDPLFAALATLLSPSILASRQAPRPHRPSPRTNGGGGGGASKIFRSTKDETEWIIDDYLAQLKGKRCGEVKLAKSVIGAMAPGTDIHSVYSASLLLRYLRTLLVRHEMMKTQAQRAALFQICLLYTSDAADEEDSVDLGGRRIIKKKKNSIEQKLELVQIDVITRQGEADRKTERL
eukprot:TRINITY_DN8609_c0_g1_i1.p1 TRINITY_DN8609_c0_g1~~TRINITY_DN8609_c0_g1_i1.p1  ORF type:complete len:369 (-),score=63.74 TRINITY_DN8609_c0_g1_i1:6-1112(-)